MATKIVLLVFGLFWLASGIFMVAKPESALRNTQPPWTYLPLWGTRVLGVVVLLGAAWLFYLSATKRCGSCTLHGTWTANLDVTCASTISSCGYGTIWAQGNLPSVSLPRSHGVLFDASVSKTAGLVTITVTDASGPVSLKGARSCSPNVVSAGANGDAEAAQITLYQGGPNSCSFSLNTKNGQTVTVNYSGPS